MINPTSTRLCPYRPAPAKKPEALAGCPHAAAAATTAKPPKPLAYTHATESERPVDPPVPTVSLSEWENAAHYDVVVVGAGIGGMYTAWRMQGCDGSQPMGKKVGIFERTLHTGGRLHTAKVAGAAHPMDIGGMRYLPAQNPLVQGLVDHFRMDTQKFVVHGDNNLNYLRGQRSLQGEAAVLPYNLREGERGKSADQLLHQALEAVIPGHAEMSRPELEKAVAEARLGEVPLSQLGLQNVLARSLSREAIQMITDLSGYESDLQNWDAGQAILELTKSGTEYRVPKEGMSAFHDAMQHDLSRTKTDIRANRTLRRVEHDGKQFRLTFESSGGAVAVTADQLVLNLPKVPLQQVVEDSPFLQHTVLEETLSKVEANPLTRIFATYEKPWWNEMGITGGRSLTDLNLGQVYYYGNGEPGKRPYVQVYNDGERSKFWEGLQNPGEPGVSVRLEAKPQLVEELHKELEEMHGRELPRPTGLVYKRWSDPFFGAGWHTWNPGTRPRQSAESMIQPLAGLPLYVCGEAFSTAQGWVEGALQTSERVLQKMGKS